MKNKRLSKYMIFKTWLEEQTYRTCSQDVETVEETSYLKKSSCEINLFQIQRQANSPVLLEHRRGGFKGHSNLWKRSKIMKSRMWWSSQTREIAQKFYKKQQTVMVLSRVFVGMFGLTNNNYVGFHLIHTIVDWSSISKMM